MPALWIFLACWLVVSVTVLVWAGIEVRATGKTPTFAEFLVRRRQGRA